MIAYKQPVTAPEIMEIRGVQGAGVLKTLLDRKLIAAAGRKNVIGKPILYKTTKEFLIQFGLKDLSELPSLKEFEEMGRFATRNRTAPPAADTAESPPSPTPRTGTGASAHRSGGLRSEWREERLQKILSHAGVASRRKAEDLILEGRVAVNGKVVTELGSKADPERDHVKVDGKLLRSAERHVYLALTSPAIASPRCPTRKVAPP